MTIRTFSWPEPAAFVAFAHRAFQQMKASGTRTLVIDVRHNGGGGDALWLQGLLPYLADRPYRWASRYTKESAPRRPCETRTGGRCAERTRGNVERSAVWRSAALRRQGLRPDRPRHLIPRRCCSPTRCRISMSGR
ncbi:hypothetical protein ISN34_06655 [Xanthomonas translucens pv. translucens]|nr:hypothetical protein ISN30_07475 [Xanthomonas translucens pv. translucens]UKE50075.1 hypothetical protein KCU57_15385 [Xanthomonas translucens]QSQ32540.1 hypothetical protein ISN31_11465 [Xanthomonas translucens pv. translucens]QSQ46542.1 hypothetical protein ISN34_06655 [Xanthomonas translucens pv. translucens]UNT97539.1 hypothetical protein KBQ49_10340 [Xanthomonas translucens pv. translucens]